MLSMIVIPTIDLIAIDKDIFYRRKNIDNTKTILHYETFLSLFPISLLDTQDYKVYQGEDLENLLQEDEWKK